MASPTPPPATRLLHIATILLVIAMFAKIVEFALLLPTLGAQGTLVDFDAFYIVGRLFWEGRIAAAYDVRVMAEIQNALVGHEGFMPWTYPPQFDLIALSLPALPRGIAYALFTGLTLAAYLAVLARLAGPALLWVLIALAPALYVALTIGQNAFLTGALIGLFCVLSLRGSALAGVPLGLLVIKPHLGIGLTAHALAKGRWAVIGWALAVTIVSSALATWVLGVDIWAAFLAGAEQAGAALRTDFYPLFRMTSIYAALQSLGVPPGVALWVQGAVGLGAMALILLAVRRGLPPNQTLALAGFTAALISPYLYDYDMVVIGVALALIAADLRARTGILDRAVLLGLLWVAGGWGMVHALLNAGLAWQERAAIARDTLSYGAFAYLIALALIARILRRPARAQAFPPRHP